MEVEQQEQRIDASGDLVHHGAAAPAWAKETTSTHADSYNQKVPMRKLSYQSLILEEANISRNHEEGKCIIAPSKPLDESWIPLSSLDKFILPIYIPVFLIYESIPEASFVEFVCKLQESLSQVLVPYYPFAGRLEKNGATQSWELHCNNVGVEFQVVHLDEELRKTKYCKPCLELRLLAPTLEAVPAEEGAAVHAMSVQVTRFKCGAVAIGCSFHHHVGDAHGVSMFMQAWSQLAQGKPVTVTPVHDRASVLQDNATSATPVPPPAAIVGTRDQEQHVITTTTDDFGDSALEGFVLDADAIHRLKEMAPGSTSFEATTAFFVRHAIKASSNLSNGSSDVAVGPDHVDDQLAKFVLMVDFRSRLGAMDYAGNAALPKAVIAPRPKFLEGPLANAVQPIHEAVKSADDAYFRAFVQYAGRGPPSSERALAVSSCARVPIYGVDFGWGFPGFAGIMPPVPRLVPEFLLFLPNSKKDGLVVYLQLRKDVLEAVQADPEFASIATKYRPLEEPYSSKL